MCPHTENEFTRSSHSKYSLNWKSTKIALKVKGQMKCHQHQTTSRVQHGAYSCQVTQFLIRSFRDFVRTESLMTLITIPAHSMRAGKYGLYYVTINMTVWPSSEVLRVQFSRQTHNSLTIPALQTFQTSNNCMSSTEWRVGTSKPIYDKD